MSILIVVTRFSSDDLHPDDLVKGHINLLVKEALDKGINLWNVLRCASIIQKSIIT